MSRMKAVKILLFYRDIDKEIAFITEAIAPNIPASASAAMCELRAELARLDALKLAIFQEINNLPFIQKTILYDFYIKGFQWVQISARVNYGVTQCKRIRNHALDNLAEFFINNPQIVSFHYPQ